MLVSHEPFLVQSICNRAIVLEAGRIIFEGTAVEGVNFHFQLGRKQSSNPVEAFGRATLDAARGTNWATPQSGDGMQMMDEEAAPAHYIRRGELSPHRPVAIDLIEVLPEEGEHLRTGSPAKVVLRYRSNIATEVLWGFTFSTEDLQINIASCSKGLDDGCSHLKAGEHYLVCRIPDFPLLAGVYAIRGGIGETESKAALAALGYEDAPCYFTVAASDINWTSNENIVRNNLVAIKIEWDY